MKHLFCSLCFLAVVGLLQGAHQEWLPDEMPFYGDARPPRVIQVGKTPILRLEQGGANVEIVVAKTASKATQYAAEALQNYLGRRLDCVIPLVNHPNAEKISLIVGINRWSEEAGIDHQRLCRDAFIIKSHGRDVYILGRDSKTADLKRNDQYGGIWGTLNEHATLFGVYDFLERFCGVRFYFPNELGIYIPKNQPVELPEISIYDRPDFEVRNLSFYSGQWEDEKPKKNPYADSISPQKNIYSKMLRLQTKYVPNCHGLGALKLDERFRKSHPEYFALRSDGRRYCEPSMAFAPQLCYSSEVMEVITQDALAILRNQHPSSRGVPGEVWLPSEHLPGRIFGMMPQDAYQNCRCDECQKELSTLQSTSNFMWSKTAQVAKRVKAELGRGYISQMAYYPYHLVPEVDIPDNVLVMVATKGPWGIANPQQLQRENARIKAWTRKINGKTWLWNYAGKFGNLNMPGVPCVSPRAVANYYQYHRENIYGAFMESETDKLIYSYLNYYLFSKVAWDNHADVEQILKEHYQLMFGAAATAMEKLFNSMEEKWVHHIGGRTVETALGPMGAPPSENELWTRIYDRSHLKWMQDAFDWAEHLTAEAGDTESLKRVRYFRREFLNPLLAAHKNYLSRNDSIGAFKETLPAVLHLQPTLGKAGQPLETTVRVSLDDEWLNLFFQCQEPEPSRMVAVERPKDDPEAWRDNNVEIFLDPAGTRRGFYQLIVNSKGALTDQYCAAVGSNTHGDLSWDSAAQVKVEVLPTGWQAQVRIPRKSFREEINPQGMVANFTRNRVLDNQQHYYSWSPFLIRGFHEVENFGTLLLQPPKNTNILKNSDFVVTRKGRNMGAWILPPELPAGVQVSFDKSSFVFGGQSLKITNTNTETKLLFSPTQIVWKIKPNQRYRISYYLRLENVVPMSAEGGVTMNIWNTKNLWLPANKFVGSIPWFKQSFEFTSAPDTVPKVTYIKPMLIHCHGTVWFDGVTLEELP